MEEKLASLIEQIIKERGYVHIMAQKFYEENHRPSYRYVGQIEAYSQVLSMIDILFFDGDGRETSDDNFWYD